MNEDIEYECDNGDLNAQGMSEVAESNNEATCIGPKVVDLRIDDVMAPRGYETIPTCLVKENIVLRVANGLVELIPVKKTDHHDTYQWDMEDRRVFPEVEVTYIDELAVYEDALTLNMVDFLLKYGGKE